ncbi:hypothetical protein C8R47DRAFT_1086659, partial [Mycena vitilis]
FARLIRFPPSAGIDSGQHLLLALAPAPHRLALPENADGQDISSSKRGKHTVSYISQCISRSCHRTPRIASGCGRTEWSWEVQTAELKIGIPASGTRRPWTSVGCCLSRGLPIFLVPRTDHCQMSDLSGCLPRVTGTQHCPPLQGSCWFSPSLLCRRPHWSTGQ